MPSTRAEPPAATDPLDDLPAGAWLGRPDGTVEYLNRSLRDYLGCPPTPPGDGWALPVHPDDRDRVASAWRRAVRAGELFAADYRLRRADGVYRWHTGRARPVRDDTGRVLRWVGSSVDVDDFVRAGPHAEVDGHVVDVGGRPACVELARDVTARRRAEAVVQRSEALFRLVWESAADGMRLTDPAGTVTAANPAYCRLLGLTADRLVGRPMAEAYAPARREDVMRKHRERFAARSVAAHTEIEAELWDGRARRFEVGNSFLDLPGEPAVLLSIFRDVTERRRLEEQVRQAQKMEAVGQLAGGVAHDFNNLLTVINGYADLLLSTLPPGDPARGPLGQIRQAGERSAGLTRQLLAFSRREVVAPQLLDPNAAVREMEEMLRRVIGEDVRLVTAPAPGVGLVLADPGQLEQVLLNLALNARDAMPTGGTLTVATEAAEVGPAAVTGLPPGRYAVLAVSDTGCGMTDEVKARAFEPFFTTKGVGKGTGLGLAVVHGVAAQAGGAVEVQTAPGAGATFRVYLPVVGDAPREVRAPPSRARAVPRGAETVLLVEDESAVRSLLRRVLVSAGYTVLDAADGAEALRVAAAHGGPVDLLLTDVVMPGGGGRQLADALCASRPGLRVLFISGYTDDAVVRHGVTEEEVNFLHKPFTAAALAEKVREVLDQPQDGVATQPP
jgi:PAS domain S-box-containing protein